MTSEERKTYNRNYLIAHKDRLKQYRLDHAEDKKEYDRLYQLNNKSKILERKRLYRLRNKLSNRLPLTPTQLEAKKKYQINRLPLTPAQLEEKKKKQLEYRKKYYKDHIQQIKQYQLDRRLRESGKLSKRGHPLTPTQLEEMRKLRKSGSSYQDLKDMFKLRSINQVWLSLHTTQ